MNIKPAIICKSPCVKVLHFNDLKPGDKFICAPANFNDIVMPLSKFKKLVKETGANIEVYIRSQSDDFDGAVSIKTGVSYSLAEIEVEDYRVIKIEI
jgi:hypothetical protein